jgi:hypothetical protein
MGIEILKGLVLTYVRQVKDEEIHFFSGNRTFKMLHVQDCCESVWIEDVNGDFMDLVGSEILVADERSEQSIDDEGSSTFTFYTLRTNKGSVDIRWNGHSNGYYSESVDTFEVPTS